MKLSKVIAVLWKRASFLEEQQKLLQSKKPDTPISGWWSNPLWDSLNAQLQRGVPLTDKQLALVERADFQVGKPPLVHLREYLRYQFRSKLEVVQTRGPRPELEFYSKQTGVLLGSCRIDPDGDRVYRGFLVGKTWANEVLIPSVESFFQERDLLPANSTWHRVENRLEPRSSPK